MRVSMRISRQREGAQKGFGTHLRWVPEARDEAERGVVETYAAASAEERNAADGPFSAPDQSAMASGKMYFRGSIGRPPSCTS